MKKHFIKFTSLATVACLCTAATAFAQEPPHDRQPSEVDQGREGRQFHEGDRGREGARFNRPTGETTGFIQQLYPPDLVMNNAATIGLTEAQRGAIKNAMPQGSNEAREQQRAEAKKLEQLLKSERVDAAQALAQLDKMLQMENDFKRKQLEALIRVKNILTHEQQAKLNDLAREARAPRAGQERQFGPREGGPHRGEEPHFGPPEGGDPAREHSDKGGLKE